MRDASASTGRPGVRSSAPDGRSAPFAARWLVRLLAAAQARLQVQHVLLQPGGVCGSGVEWPDFAAWCDAHPGARCRLWVSSALLHELVCDPALPLADDAAALDWARPLLQHYHGDPALAWPLAAWRQGGQRGVSALRGTPLVPLRAAAAARGVTLLAVQPWWALQLRLASIRHPSLRGPEAFVLLLDSGWAAVMGLAHGKLVRLQLRCLDTADLQPYATLAALCDDAAVPTLVLGGGATQPAADAHETAAPIAPATKSPGTLATPERWLFAAPA